MGAYRFEMSNVYFVFLQVVCQEESLEMNKKKNGDTKKKKKLNDFFEKSYKAQVVR